MKIYTQTFDLAKPSPKKFWVAPYSDFAIGIKVLSNGEAVADGITVEANGQTLTAEADTVAGFTVYNISSEGTGFVKYKVTCKGQTFELAQIVTDSTVFEKKNDAEGGASIKYGASIDNFLGDVVDGKLQHPTQTTFAFECDEITNITDMTVFSSFKNNVSSLSLPNLATVTNTSMPTNIGSANLRSVDFPNLTAIDGDPGLMNAFSGCSNLSSVNLENLERINATVGLQRTFLSCTSLTSISFPKLSQTPQGGGLYNTFEGCTGLKVATFGLSSTTNLGQQAFYQTFKNCTSLETFAMPNLFSASMLNRLVSPLEGCTGLKIVDFRKLSQGADDWGNWLSGCTSLQYVIFSEATAVPQFYNAPRWFANTNDTYKIIVPDALYDEWTTTTGNAQWATISSHIVKASEYPVIMTQYGGQDNMDN